MTIAPELRSLSVQDYRRMVEAGILAADERVELIEDSFTLWPPEEQPTVPQ